MEKNITLFHEVHPTWDADKQRVIGSAPAGAFDLPYRDGDTLPHEWWVACTASGNVVGYGWIHETLSGVAEIMLAVLAGSQRQGTGSLILARLESEAAGHPLSHVAITVPETHPRRDEVQDWLAVRGYRCSPSDRTLRKPVGAGVRQLHGAHVGGHLRVGAHER